MPSVSGLPDYTTSNVILIVYTIAVTVVKSAFVIPSQCAHWRGNLKHTPEIATGGKAALAMTGGDGKKEGAAKAAPKVLRMVNYGLFLRFLRRQENRPLVPRACPKKRSPKRPLMCGWSGQGTVFCRIIPIQAYYV